MPNIYLDGNLVVLKASFTDQTGDPADPDTVVCKVKRPSGVIDLPAVIKDSVGNYQAQYSLTGLAAGSYAYRWDGTGAVQASGVGSFNVSNSVAFS